MNQLIVTVEDASLLGDLKKAISMLRGVSSVLLSNTDEAYNETTLKAMRDANEGNTIKCTSFEDYLAKVR